MSDAPAVLITGANRGLGLEFATQYAAAGWTVHATARDPAGAQSLRALGDRVRVHRLDLADAGQIAALADALDGAAMRGLVDRLEAHHTGHFLNYDGAELTW